MKRYFLWAASLTLIAQFAWSAPVDWQLAKQDSARDIRVYLRDIPGTSYKGFYATTRVRAGLSNVVAVLSDVHALPEWIARLKSAKLIRREANREVWIHSVYQLPYPFLEREAVLHSVLKQDKNGVVEVITRAESFKLQRHPKRVRLTNIKSIWRLTPERSGKVKVEMWGQGEPGGYIPPLLFNYNLPDEPLQTLRNLRQMLLREKYQEKSLDYIRDPEW
jgi:hypothetical protein